ncbi:sensor domain-containing diguanylate cyclase [Ferrimonas lipolytica]|uniref:diguanylate cyclase n=1 Tax=Ferrimonas lipolytica TaxID=2724191 RepID=A0A6H1UD57_9GAMM|nr:GGDEF domain-containing protein [Ferrimonas lipolytica]QIZ77037.1 diguanylate cyclase [Ferrimonas lipolytica]
MSDSDNSMSSETLIAKELEEARAAQKKLEGLASSYQIQIRSLIDFIHQLSLSCKGQDLNLDARLAKLRTNLSNDNNIQAVLPELAEICDTLRNRTLQSQRELKSGQDSMLTLSQRLAAIDNISVHIKREIIHFQQDIIKPTISVWDFVPKITQLASIYESLLLERLVKGEPIEATAQHQHMAHELAHQLSELEFRAKDRDSIAALKAELAGNVSVERLLQAYQLVLKLLMTEVVREKNSSHQFLSAINECLALVRDSVNDNWTVTLNNFSKQRETNRQITNQCSEMDQHLQAATEIEALKQHISAELQMLQARIKEREQEQQNDVIRLKKSMDSMRKEIETLSVESGNFKEKLVEQQRLIMTDTLTQLPNRAAMDERLKREYRNVRRNNSQLWVVVADVDNFKLINDNFGHPAGDKTLQVVATTLQNTLRKGEFVARYGGEEFVLLLPDIDEEQALHIVNRVRERVSSIPFKFGDRRVALTISFGCAQVNSNETIHETFERADGALYRAKRNGRNRVEIDK